MRVLIGLALISACKVEERTHPVIPGGSTAPVGASTGDGAVEDAGVPDDGGLLRGRVCLVTDLRDVTVCASTGVGGLTVSLGTKSATTSADGSFSITPAVPPFGDFQGSQGCAALPMRECGVGSIAAPVATSLTWQVSGAFIETSLAPFSAMSSIPAIATVDYQSLEGDNGVLEVAGQGSILAHVVSAKAPHAPVAMATATASPLGASAAYYDGIVARAWTQNSTGAYGAVWIPGLLAGSAALTIVPPGAVQQTVTGLPVVDGAITFVTVEVAP